MISSTTVPSTPQLGQSDAMDRRSFLCTVAGATGQVALWSMMNPWDWLSPAVAAEIRGAETNRLSWKAHRGSGFEGSWAARGVEGRIPEGLRGTLYRIGPGEKEVYGTRLKHFFDGNGYLSSIHLGPSGEVKGVSRFVETRERSEERAAKKMLFNDFGTASPGGSKGYKNAPSIHVVPWQGQLLALSEATAPTAVDPVTLDSKGLWNFAGTLPSKVTFTAHPKLDPETGDGFAYGITQGISPALQVFRMDRKTGQLQHIGSYRLGGFFPIHDMMITRNYVVFVIPPLKIDLLGAALGRKPVAELLEYESRDPLRVLVFRKDGKKGPVEFKTSPSAMVFHHCNAYEDEATGKVIFFSMLVEDASVFEVFKHFSEDRLPPGPKSQIARFELDPTGTSREVMRRTIGDGTPSDFPCIDPRRLGRPFDYFHAVENVGPGDDPLAFNAIASHRISKGTSHRAVAEPNHTWGEPVFVARPAHQGGSGAEDDGWILHLGYDGNADESYLDIRTAVELGLQARIRLGARIPLGFHGTFVSDL